MICLLLMWMYFRYFLSLKHVKTAILVFLGLTFVSLNVISQSMFFQVEALILYLCCLGFQDYETYYISKHWILFSLILYIILFDHIQIRGCIFGLVGYVLYKIRPNWIGSADICFLLLFGFILGFERMYVCLMISLVVGATFYLFSKHKLIPFVSCLCIGMFIAFLRGYKIWFFIYDIISL